MASALSVTDSLFIRLGSGARWHARYVGRHLARASRAEYQIVFVRRRAQAAGETGRTGA